MGVVGGGVGALTYEKRLGRGNFLILRSQKYYFQHFGVVFKENNQG